MRTRVDDGMGRRSVEVDWEGLLHLLVVRSGQRCEARTPACNGRGPLKLLDQLPRRLASIHHRRPQGMGGSDEPWIDTLPNLMLLCGDGVRGCHGYLESHRDTARDRGYLVPFGQHPGAVPVTLPGGRMVLLSDHPLYVDVAELPTFRQDALPW